MYTRLKLYFRIACTLVKRYTSPRYLHYMYYTRSYRKLFRFYMKKHNADIAASEAMNAFYYLHSFSYEELNDQFEDLIR